MYVTERTGYLPFDPENNASVGETFVVRDYELEFVGSDIYQLGSGDAVYEIDLAVYKDGAYLGEVTPSVQVVATTQQQRLNAQVLRFPLEDLFVVYRGTSFDGQSLSLDVRVNPLVGVLWAGCFLLFAGMAVSTVGRRSGKRAVCPVEPAPAASGQEGE